MENIFMNINIHCKTCRYYKDRSLEFKCKLLLGLFQSQITCSNYAMSTCACNVLINIIKSGI